MFSWTFSGCSSQPSVKLSAAFWGLYVVSIMKASMCPSSSPTLHFPAQALREVGMEPKVEGTAPDEADVDIIADLPAEDGEVGCVLDRDGACPTTSRLTVSPLLLPQAAMPTR